MNCRICGEESNKICDADKVCDSCKTSLNKAKERLNNRRIYVKQE